MSTISRFSLQGIPSPISTRGWYKVNKGQGIVNVIYERPPWVGTVVSSALESSVQWQSAQTTTI